MRDLVFALQLLEKRKNLLACGAHGAKEVQGRKNRLSAGRIRRVNEMKSAVGLLEEQRAGTHRMAGPKDRWRCCGKPTGKLIDVGEAQPFGPQTIDQINDALDAGAQII